MPPKIRLRNFIDRWALRRARYAPERNPKIIAILACIGLNLVPTALGVVSLPGSLEPYRFLGQIATAISALGCFMCVAGQLVPRRWRDVGLAVETGGCVLLGAGMLFYAAGLLYFIPLEQRAYAFPQSLGIGIGCILRFGQIALYVRGRRLATEEHDKGLP